MGGCRVERIEWGGGVQGMEEWMGECGGLGGMMEDDNRE